MTDVLHGKLVPADARAYGIVSSLTTRVAPRWQGSAAGTRGKCETSACVSYKLDDDGNVIDAKIFRATRAPRTTSAPRTSKRDNAASYAAQLAHGNNSDAD